jgi:hypothetical protein
VVHSDDEGDSFRAMIPGAQLVVDIKRLVGV